MGHTYAARAAKPGTIGAQHALMSRADDWAVVRDWLRERAQRIREGQ